MDSMFEALSFLRNKSKNLDSTITVKEHKKIVNELLSSIIQINILIAEWSKDVVETSDKSNNPEVIKFAKSSLLSLKKKMSQNLFKITGNNDRVQ